LTTVATIGDQAGKYIMREIDWQSAEQYFRWSGHLLDGVDTLLSHQEHWFWIPAGELLTKSYVLLAKHQLVRHGQTKDFAESYLLNHSIDDLCGPNSEPWKDAHSIFTDMQSKADPDDPVLAYNFNLHFSTLVRLHSKDYEWDMIWHGGRILFPQPKITVNILHHLLKEYRDR
jgi:hypothetical protein